MTIYKPFDIVEVPFPFSDLPRSKRRKALVVSHEEFNKANGCTVLLMITSAVSSAWMNDVPITGWQSSGLNKPCVARMKFFTLDNGLILDRAGTLSTADARAVRAAVRQMI